MQLHAGETPTSAMGEALIEFLKPRVACYALPRSIDFVDELPRLPTGKLYKKALRDRYRPAKST